MLVHIPDHFSSKFLFDFRKTPSTVVDRSSTKSSVIGVIAGIMLLILGTYELFSFITAPKVSGQSLFAVEIFAFLIILLAFGIIFISAFALIRYKKFTFDGKNFQIVYHPALGINHTLSEPLENYTGVRLRVLFVQAGLFNKNRYIIDLYHQDSNKIIPLYISTKNRNIRKIWERYARIFRLPALSVSDRGFTQRDPEDLDKSIKELSQENKLPLISRGKLPAPASLIISEDHDDTSIKTAGVYWDLFSSLFLMVALSAIFFLVVGGIYLTFIGTNIPVKYLIIGLLLAVLTLFFSAKMFCTYVLVLNNSEVIVQERLFSSILKTDRIDVNKTENVELSYNPTIDRYSLSVISDDKVITFGSRLPVDDLLWLKDFVIRKLIGN